MRIKFTEIPSKLKYPSQIRGKLSTMHSEIITYACNHYRSTSKFQREIIYCLNVLSYYCISGDSIPSNWNITNPFVNIPVIDSDMISNTVPDLMISLDDVIWDIEDSEQYHISDDDATKEISASCAVLHDDSAAYMHTPEPYNGTSAQDLYLQPEVPLFDYSNPFVDATIDNTRYTIYSSLPVIPTRQCEISVTTNASLMSDADRLKLFPNSIFYTRPSLLYTHVQGCEFIDPLGSIVPIKGFTSEQILDNIIKYPHIEGVTRLGKQDGQDKFVPFWKFIELDNHLYKTADVWSDFTEVSELPVSPIIMAEYVVRRYLLERDILGIDHKYKIFGDLDPFLTLFLPIDIYDKFGYTNPLDIAKQCVDARISYLTSRNPILRRISNCV